MTREEFLTKLPVLVKDYQPAPDVLGQIGNVELLMIVGPSGVGKTTLIQRSGLVYVPSDTTRPIRPEEKNGEDYFFRSDYDQIVQEINAGRYAQVAVDSGGDLKATKDTSYPTSGMAIMAVVADVLPIFKELGFKKTISAFITPPGYDEWMRRLLIHMLTPEQFALRIDEAKRSFSIAMADPDMHFILNDDLEAANNQLVNLIAGNINLHREQDAKLAAGELLNKLSETNS